MGLLVGGGAGRVDGAAVRGQGCVAGGWMWLCVVSLLIGGGAM